MSTCKKEELIIYGWVHENAKIIKRNIPKDIMDIIDLYYEFFEWDDMASNSYFEINGNKIKAILGSWTSGFSKNYISSGIINWKLKINNQYVMIGIISNESRHKGRNHFWRVKGGFSYFGFGGNCFRQKLDGYDEEWKKYGEHYDKNDIITVHLDMNELQLSFSKNDINQGIIPWKLIKNTKYHLAIATYGVGNEVELLEIY